jgi:cation diffusion facilitator family transporter
MVSTQSEFRLQKIITLVGVLLLIGKLIAWRLTDSISIFTDAAENLVNIVAGLLAMYSLYLSSLPRDSNHPYGHGKVEFITAGLEGAFIVVAGISAIYQAIIHFFHPESIQKLDAGLLIITIAALINYYLGWYSTRLGKQKNSLPLIAGGKHLQSDTYTTIGIIVGLVIIKFTGWKWIDPLIAILLALWLIYTGYKIVRTALAGIMDEADEDLLQELIEYLNTKRNLSWIDLHHLRIVKYGSVLHIDAHLTIPWYYTIAQGHQEVDLLSEEIKKKYGERVELSIHTDACIPQSCSLCLINSCPHRRAPFQKSIEWSLQNVLENKRQSLKEE